MITARFPTSSKLWLPVGATLALLAASLGNLEQIVIDRLRCKPYRLRCKPFG
jgi:hypothetical protein